MADIFISYAREDLDRVRPIAEALQAHGWDVWWDLSSLRSGQLFNQAIQDALNQVKCVVVLWSKASVKSKWVEAEAYWAWNKGKLASVLIDERLELPVPFNTTHSENLSGWSGDTAAPAFRKLTADLTAVAGAPTEEAARHEAEEEEAKAPEETLALQKATSRSHQTKAAVLVGAFVLVIAVSVAVFFLQREPDPLESSTKENGATTSEGQGGEAVPHERPVELSQAQWRDVQRSLNDIGFDAGPIDGRTGAKTREAISLFQKDRGFLATGQLTEVQRMKLLADAREAAHGRLGAEPETPTSSFALPEMVEIPAGCFAMGNPPGEGNEDARPQHRVCVERFALGKYEVTFDEYDRFAKATQRKKPKDRGWGRGTRPVIYVNWQDAQDYARWLSTVADKSYRLPSEAEWEYAARAGTKTRYWWGEEIGENRTNCLGCSSQWDGKQTAPVGSFDANPWGLHDPLGNVWEWVEDCWHENYNGAPADGRAWLEKDRGNCDRRVVRGGAWDMDPEGLLSAFRSLRFVEARTKHIGFRLAQDL